MARLLPLSSPNTKCFSSTDQLTSAKWCFPFVTCSGFPPCDRHPEAKSLAASAQPHPKACCSVSDNRVCISFNRQGNRAWLGAGRRYQHAPALVYAPPGKCIPDHSKSSIWHSSTVPGRAARLHKQYQELLARIVEKMQKRMHDPERSTIMPYRFQRLSGGGNVNTASSEMRGGER